MCQSIPAVPIPPGNREAFAHIVSAGGGAFTILSWPGGLGISMRPSKGFWQQATLFKNVAKIFF